MCTFFVHIHTFSSTSPSYWYQPPPPPRDCSALLFSNFVEKEKKKKMTFLLVGGKGSYTGSFLVIFSCMYVCIIILVGLSPLIFFILP
jgi:hypothetical protein